MIWRVYKIVNDVTGHAYIGITSRSVSARFQNHIREIMSGSNTALHCAIRKYGPERFSVAELTECVSALEAKVCERALISAHGTFARTGNGYNLTCGGDGNWGWKPTEETKIKIGLKSIGRLTPDLQARMASARTGKKKRPRTAAHRAALSAALKGRVISPEWRAKLSAAGRLRKDPPETIAKRIATRATNAALRDAPKASDMKAA